MKAKICGNCKVYKLVSDFRESKLQPDGYCGWCISCQALFSCTEVKKKKKKKKIKKKSTCPAAIKRRKKMADLIAMRKKEEVYRQKHKKALGEVGMLLAEKYSKAYAEVGILLAEKYPKA